jgi:nitrile hydratase
MRFRTGDPVRVRDLPTPGHVRTPGYVRGKVGRVEAVRRPYRVPEGLAYGGAGLPEQVLYLVGFEQRALWAGYPGGADDRLVLDLYEHWLEPAAAGPRGG